MINPLLLTPEVQQYIREQLHKNVSDIALRKSPFEGVLSKELANQVEGIQRCRQKLPSWYHQQGLFYPKKLSLEQSSSELTAFYKASALAPNSQIADLTGGFGVDSTAFSRFAGAVYYNEQVDELAEIVRHNAQVFGAKSLQVSTGTAEDFLAKLQPGKLDVIYLDPARRNEGRKVYKITDCQPNVVNLLPELKQKAKEIWVKLAPMLDVSDAIKSLPGLNEIQVISVGGECKELLCKIGSKQDVSDVKIVAVCLKRTAECFIMHESKAWEQYSNQIHGNIQEISFLMETEKNAKPFYSLPECYLYEPDAALLKAGAYKYTSVHYGINKLHAHTHLYTSKTLIETFMGKISEVISIQPFSALKKRKNTLSGNVITRNFPLKAEEIRKKYKIGESPDVNYYCCTELNGELIVIETRTTHLIR